MDSNILLIEDSAGDIALFKFALREGASSARLTVARDGAEALRFIQHAPPYSKSEHPDLVVLDWNLPKETGSEILRAIRTAPDLAHTPVVVFTTSENRTDLAAADELGADRFITKPVDVGTYLDTVRALVAEFLYRPHEQPS